MRRMCATCRPSAVAHARCGVERVLGVGSPLCAWRYGSLGGVERRLGSARSTIDSSASVRLVRDGPTGLASITLVPCESLRCPMRVYRVVSPIFFFA